MRNFPNYHHYWKKTICVRVCIYFGSFLSYSLNPGVFISASSSSQPHKSDWFHCTNGKKMNTSMSDLPTQPAAHDKTFIL